ncbi:malate synthase G [Novosphingobium flavum]|uniref:Malate synthase G n=1 Tax=Novosphingobium flavum TaxID=1778672 RepID=A0A7X1FSY6_9SPHN|nr:malate synthase G [Novosphingobium flavum]MBC2665897.1 malate synthase G [Novosphingobium flavum]
MTKMLERAGLSIDEALCHFVEERALPSTGIEAQAFWAGAAGVFARFSPENRQLLARRNDLQARIDLWHMARTGHAHDPAAYSAFLSQIGYLVPEPAPFTVDTQNVDPEIATMAGPQLVVPVLNARFALNAANARWGSLYDALYGTDALPGQPKPGAFDPERGAQVICRARRFLNETIPGWQNAVDGAPHPALVGRREGGLLFRHNGLHVELVIDGEHPIGCHDPLRLADVIVEAALTTIVDFEDSIAAVDGADKVEAYANWLGLMQGTLTARFDKNGHETTREMAPDRAWTAPDGTVFTLPGRSLMFVRNVGHLMTTPALRLADGSEAPEGILDAIVTSVIGMHDLTGKGMLSNSRTGSIYIVKPKMHGPEEAAFADRLFDAVEDMLGLARHTIKIGVMDEERRTSVNLAACIHAVRHRIVFINTGFLDRTGDEIHTAMRAGPMVRKGTMKEATWIKAYEARNVAIGLACGLSGRAQIGKGMWAMPDRMADMLAQKSAHPLAGASTAWVPSPTAATLHALHYHAIDVFARQRELAETPVPALDALLTLPLAANADWTAEEIRAELDNNAQGVLGYVVRWIDQGVGCSKVPDIHDVGLMEDRATLRISSQHMTNWLLHGVCSAADVEAALLRMAARVDAQNAGDPLYRPMARAPQASAAFQAAHALVFEGLTQPSGYTEPLLHAWRARVKQQVNELELVPA